MTPLKPSWVLCDCCPSFFLVHKPAVQPQEPRVCMVLLVFRPRLFGDSAHTWHCTAIIAGLRAEYMADRRCTTLAVDMNKRVPRS